MSTKVTILKTVREIKNTSITTIKYKMLQRITIMTHKVNRISKIMFLVNSKNLQHNSNWPKKFTKTKIKGIKKATTTMSPKSHFITMYQFKTYNSHPQIKEIFKYPFKMILDTTTILTATNS